MCIIYIGPLRFPRKSIDSQCHYPGFCSEGSGWPGLLVAMDLVLWAPDSVSQVMVFQSFPMPPPSLASAMWFLVVVAQLMIQLRGLVGVVQDCCQCCKRAPTPVVPPPPAPPAAPVSDTKTDTEIQEAQHQFPKQVFSTKSGERYHLRRHCHQIKNRTHVDTREICLDCLDFAQKENQ